jgi:hypothetical protein
MNNLSIDTLAPKGLQKHPFADERLQAVLKMSVASMLGDLTATS